MRVNLQTRFFYRIEQAIKIQMNKNRKKTKINLVPLIQPNCIIFLGIRYTRKVSDVLPEKRIFSVNGVCTWFPIVLYHSGFYLLKF